MLLGRLRHDDDLRLPRLVARVPSGRTQAISLRCLLRIIGFGPLHCVHIVPTPSLGEHTLHLTLYIRFLLRVEGVRIFTGFIHIYILRIHFIQ